MSAPAQQPAQQAPAQPQQGQQAQPQRQPTNQEIIKAFNDAKQKYSLFFQKALEIEQELVEHNVVANTLSKLPGERRCFRKIGGVLVEKDLVSVKKDLDVEIANIKQTLDVVYKSMKQQEEAVQQFEKKYGDVLKDVAKKQNEKKEETAKASTGGVVV